MRRREGITLKTNGLPKGGPKEGEDGRTGIARREVIQGGDLSW